MPRRLSLFAILGFALLGACEVGTGKDAKGPDIPRDLPTLPVVDVRLKRADLLLAAVRAGSAAAAGQDDAMVQRQLAGRPFELGLRFGCATVAAGEARSATFDPRARVVKLSVPAEIGPEVAALVKIAGQDLEAAEGFWIRRPWLLEPACPPASVGDTPPAPAPSSAPLSAPVSPVEPFDLPRIGIAQVFTHADARTHRREQRAYQATDSLAADEVPSRDGYDLVIEGRLYAPSGDQVIACAPAVERAPTCLISARFDLVSIERADTGKLLGEWPSG